MKCYRSGCCSSAVVAASAYDAVEVRLCVLHARLQELAGESPAHFRLLAGVEDPAVVDLLTGDRSAAEALIGVR